MRRSLTATFALAFATVLFTAAAAPNSLRAAQRTEAELTPMPSDVEQSRDGGWFQANALKQRDEIEPPSKLAIIACRVDSQSLGAPSSASRVAGPDWLLPLECMRVVETVTDAAAMTNLWLRQMTPNLADYDTCAEVAMNYAPEWEGSHRNWVIVKIGCPTKIVDADGRTIGWHMPPCQGVLPGTTYPLRCRFDPSEI